MRQSFERKGATPSPLCFSRENAQAPKAKLKTPDQFLADAVVSVESGIAFSLVSSSFIKL